MAATALVDVEALGEGVIVWVVEVVSEVAAAALDEVGVVATAVAPSTLLMNCRSIEDQSSNQCIQIHYSWV